MSTQAADASDESSDVVFEETRTVQARSDSGTPYVNLTKFASQFPGLGQGSLVSVKIRQDGSIIIDRHPADDD